METRKESHRSAWAIKVSGIAGWSCAVLLLIHGTGCTEHRMTLEEFIALEQQTYEISRSTTQPAANTNNTPHRFNHQLGPYKSGAGDVLLVTLSGLEGQVTGAQIQARVDRNGKIRLPAVGEVPVGDMELQDVEEAVQQAYIPEVYRDVAVHITLIEASTTKVLVRGAVTDPGFIPLRRTERNLLFAMVGAGGVTEAASGIVTLRRIRQPAEEIKLNLTEPDGIQAALAMEPLEDGDAVTVEAATPNAIFVGGLVNSSRPQIYPYGVKMTVLQALAAAGGLRNDVTPREATLIRHMPDGTDARIKLNLDNVTTGEEPNITLAAGDILWVPHTLETRVQEWFNQNIFFRAGITTTANINYDARALAFMNSNAEKSALRQGQSSSNLQDLFDPFGFLLQNQAIQQIPSQITTGP